MEELIEENKFIRTQLDNLNESFHDLIDRHEELEEQLEEEKECFEKEVQEMETKITELEDANKSLNEGLDKAIGDKNSLSTRYNQLQDLVDILNNNISDLCIDNEIVFREKEEYKKKYEHLKKKYDMLLLEISKNGFEKQIINNINRRN